MEVSDKLHDLVTLPLAKEPRSPLCRRLVGSRAGMEAVAKGKKHLPRPCRESNHGRPFYSLASIKIAQPWLCNCLMFQNWWRYVWLCAVSGDHGISCCSFGLWMNFEMPKFRRIVTGEHGSVCRRRVILIHL